MILVVSPNLAVDRTLDVPGFQSGRIFRSGETLTVPGGKGANVARALTALGAPVHLVGLIAGWTGRFIREGLAEEKIPATLVEVDGVSRTCTLVVDRERGDATAINEDGELSATPEDLARLDQVLNQWIPKARVVVCTGSLPSTLPPDFHARVVQKAREAGALTVVDTSGEPLRHAVAARPHLVKPNRAELLAFHAEGPGDQASDPAVAADNGPDGDLQHLAQTARRLLNQGVGTAVVSMGAAGALAVTPADLWVARAPRVSVVDPIGAGDSMVAALSHGLLQRLTLPDMLSMAVASGSCDVSTFGGGLVTAEGVANLRTRVTVSPVPQH